MPQLEAYLHFKDNCAEAMRFYERVLGGKIQMMMTCADSPVKNPSFAAYPNKIMHSSLRIGDQTLMASDWCSEDPYEPMQGFSLSLAYETAEDARRIFGVLADGGTIIMPIDKTFWAEAFGMVTDRFGTPWMISGGMQQ